MGMYYVLTQEEMNKRLTSTRENIPTDCFTEKCALDAGQNLAVSKVVLGEMDLDATLYILKLKIFDLESRNFESKVMVMDDLMVRVHMFNKIERATLGDNVIADSYPEGTNTTKKTGRPVNVCSETSNEAWRYYGGEEVSDSNPDPAKQRKTHQRLIDAIGRALDEHPLDLAEFEATNPFGEKP